MNIKRAIELVRENIHNSCYNMKPFEMLRCKPYGSCFCVSGLKWDNLTITNDYIQMKNGYKFKLSMDLGNLLEWECMNVFQPTRLNQDWVNRNPINDKNNI